MARVRDESFDRSNRNTFGSESATTAHAELRPLFDVDKPRFPQDAQVP